MVVHRRHLALDDVVRGHGRRRASLGRGLARRRSVASEGLSAAAIRGGPLSSGVPVGPEGAAVELALRLGHAALDLAVCFFHQLGVVVDRARLLVEAFLFQVVSHLVGFVFWVRFVSRGGGFGVAEGAALGACIHRRALATLLPDHDSLSCSWLGSLYRAAGLIVCVAEDRWPRCREALVWLRRRRGLALAGLGACYRLLGLAPLRRLLRWSLRHNRGRVTFSGLAARRLDSGPIRISACKELVHRHSAVAHAQVHGRLRGVRIGVLSLFRTGVRLAEGYLCDRRLVLRHLEDVPALWRCAGLLGGTGLIVASQQPSAAVRHRQHGVEPQVATCALFSGLRRPDAASWKLSGARPLSVLLQPRGNGGLHPAVSGLVELADGADGVVRRQAREVSALLQSNHVGVRSRNAKAVGRLVLPHSCTLWRASGTVAKSAFLLSGEPMGGHQGILRHALLMSVTSLVEDLEPLRELLLDKSAPLRKARPRQRRVALLVGLLTGELADGDTAVVGRQRYRTSILLRTPVFAVPLLLGGCQVGRRK